MISQPKSITKRLVSQVYLYPPKGRGRMTNRTLPAILLQHKTQISRRAACETVVSTGSLHRGEFFHPSPQEPRALSLNQLGLAIVIEFQGLNHIVGDVGLGEQREPRVF